MKQQKPSETIDSVPFFMAIKIDAFKIEFFATTVILLQVPEKMT